MRKATPVSDGLLSASDAQPPSEMPEIEARHVKDVYDSIAREWHGTRYKSWPRVEEFVLSLPRGSLVADLGCGNGKMAPACHQGGHFALGIDISIELVRICAHEQALEVARHQPAQCAARSPSRLAILAGSSGRRDAGAVPQRRL